MKWKKPNLKDMFQYITTICLFLFYLLASIGDASCYPSTSRVADSMLSNAGLFGKYSNQIIIASSVIGAAFIAHRFLSTPARKRVTSTSNKVADNYDDWTDDSILEKYWGEHVHLGYYTQQEQKMPFWQLNLVKVCDEMVHKLVEFSGLKSTGQKCNHILDIGCGVGGTTRLLEKHFPESLSITGISISPKQIEKAIYHNSQLVEPTRCSFVCMDAQEMTFHGDSMDLIWICESSEHILDKTRLFDKISCILKVGGHIVFVAWTQRNSSKSPFSQVEINTLNYLYDQWSHAPFESPESMEKIITKNGKLQVEKIECWTSETLPTWHHIISLGITNPLPWIKQPKKYLSLARDAWCLHRMHNAFKSGLMEYSVFLIKRFR